MLIWLDSKHVVEKNDIMGMKEVKYNYLNDKDVYTSVHLRKGVDFHIYLPLKEVVQILNNEVKYGI